MEAFDSIEYGVNRMQLAGDSIEIQSEETRVQQSKFQDISETAEKPDKKTFVYYDEWMKLFGASNFMSILKNEAFNGNLRSCRFRSVCWKIFLHCLSEEPSEWQETSRLAHELYEELKTKILVNPRKDTTKTFDLLLDNPLSQEASSSWHQYFQDTDLKITIMQDVTRTFPEVEFFQAPEIREIMVNVLFCYARKHPQIAYRQGMHELLAPLIFVLHSDQQAFLHAVDNGFIHFFDILQKDTLWHLLNPAYLEHDSYAMFSSLMDKVEPWYLTRDGNPPKYTLINAQPFARPQDVNAYTVIISKLSYIHELLLRRHDYELYTHLEKLEIAPQIYGIRWLRLLFGREFSLQDLLVVWDVIFADGSNFGLVDYVFISMLKYIRKPLLAGDYATCLGYLMRYPAVTDVHYIIDMALHLRNPKKHPEPIGYNSHMLKHIPTVGGRPDIHRAPLSQRFPSVKKEKTVKAPSRPRSLGVNVLHSSQATNKDCSTSSDTAISIQSHSPGPEYEYQKNEERIGEGEKQSVTSRSNPSLATVETELRPLRKGFHEEKSSTLPRSFGQNGRASLLRSEPQDQYPSVKGLAPNTDISSGTATRLVRHDSLKAVVQMPAEASKKDLSQEVIHLQGQLNDLKSMGIYCAEKMTPLIDLLQECILKEHLANEDEMLIALAGIKQVRDIMKGTLKFSLNMLDTEDISINDNHYRKDKHDKKSPISEQT